MAMRFTRRTSSTWRFCTPCEKYAMATRTKEADYQQALVAWLSVPVTRHPHDLYAARIWALRHNVSAYDAAYVALAEAFRAPLITRDERLAGSTGHQARIEFIPA